MKTIQLDLSDEHFLMDPLDGGPARYLDNPRGPEKHWTLKRFLMWCCAMAQKAGDTEALLWWKATKELSEAGGKNAVLSEITFDIVKRAVQECNQFVYLKGQALERLNDAITSSGKEKPS